MPPSNNILLYINGNRRQISGKPALVSLLAHLRQSEHLTGTKLACGEGRCGACTVLLSHYDKSISRISHRAVNACLLPLAACDGMAVTTIEAVGDRAGGLAPVQRVLAEKFGSQCGFCTPGIVMSMFALLREHATTNGPKLNAIDVQHNFDGNLCRCTGYRPILDAFQTLVDDAQVAVNGCAMGNECCKVTGNARRSESLTVPNEEETEKSNGMNGAVGLDREYVFPPELIGYEPPELDICNGRWLRPITLDGMIRAKQQFPKALIVVGNTELGIETKFKALDVPVYLCATHVPELSCVHETECGVHIGPSVTWSQLNAFITNIISQRERSRDGTDSKMYQIRSLKAVKSQLRWFAGKQIRNVAAVGGNIITASPISDINPVWMAVGASFTLLDCETRKERIVSASDFFISYRKIDMTMSEILVRIFVPWNKSPYDTAHAFKVSRRREDDIAIVSSGIRIHLEYKYVTEHHSTKEPSSAEWTIAEVAIALGGLAPRSIRAIDVEKALRCKRFSEETLHEGLDVIGKSLKLGADVPGGMAHFRVSLVGAFLFKAFVDAAMQVDEELSKLENSGCPSAFSQLGIELDVEELRLMESTNRENYKGVQIWPDVEASGTMNVMGKPLKHCSADIQVCGEAKYLDDIAKIDGELQGVLVLSTEAHAEIISVDDAEAKMMPGVHSIVKYEDVRGSNAIGPIYADEECFAEDKVTTLGQVIALVTADTLEEARNAARAVRVEYNVLPAVVTIEDAIAAESYARNEPVHSIEKGDVDQALNDTGGNRQVVEGEVRIGAQEHWYLEPQGTIAIPDENGEMTILSSTQAPGKTQITVASVLGEPMHKVVCKVKRLGGGFGGKETRNIFISAATAVAAQKTGRPIRVILDRDVDMLISGTRHAFLGKYKVAYEPDGRVTALDLRVYLNMGNTADLSIPVLDRSLYHGMNCYDIPNVRFLGRACYTNSPSSTGFRGFGSPQGMMIAETVIERVAWETKQPPMRVRELNMFGKNGNGCTTPVGMEVNVTPLLGCWDGVLEDAAFASRRKAVDEFNSSHPYRKRGISVIPSMFGIGFDFKSFNQAGALVHIYQGDGSVLISHGGVEMGQGLHTKICQVAATELGVPMEKVFISETATDKVPNASPTAASASSDLYGMAVKKACEILNKNLQGVKDELGPSATWEAVVQKAWFNRIGLSATGFYKASRIDHLDLSRPGARGRPFLYYTNGAAVSEVEIDVLTGESTVMRTDIVMDVGRALNPAIDVGQIEGAFVQGLGWCTMEEVVRGSENSHAWVKVGQTFTLGPSTYKIPGFLDIPKDFRVRILKTRNEQDTIHSSKGIGEPPLFLAASVFFAIRDAIAACRRENRLSEWFELDSPATVERIRMACGDTILQRTVGKDGINTRPALSL